MIAFIIKTVQQVRQFIIILGGLTFLVIPFALIFSGTAFVVVIGLGILTTGVVWTKILQIKISLFRTKREVSHGREAK
jgi:ABC-type protease/lipase transport system fused ATPase/permease subunit